MGGGQYETHLNDCNDSCRLVAMGGQASARRGNRQMPDDPVVSIQAFCPK
ncbi:MAG: hypothetical protein JW705_00830 [Methanosarcinaceae archaeon]|nr:hypothetical protein [Methanosarcinaceae archaeon]